MKPFLSRIAASFLAFVAFAALAQPAGRDIDELMRKSGLHNQLGSMFESLRADSMRMRQEAPKGGPGDLDDATFERLVRAMEHAYAPDRIRKLVAAQLAKDVTPEDEKVVIAWLDSDVGKRMTELEVTRDAQKSDPQVRLREAADYFKSAPAERRELATRISAALNDGDAAVDQMVSLMTALVYGMSLADPRFDEGAVKKLKDTLEAQRPEAAATYRQMAMIVHAHTYRDVPVADLTRYVEFMESPAGLRYHDATNVALKVAIARASIDMGKIFMESAPKNPTRS